MDEVVLAKDDEVRVIRRVSELASDVSEDDMKERTENPPKRTPSRVSLFRETSEEEFTEKGVFEKTIDCTSTRSTSSKPPCRETRVKDSRGVGVCDWRMSAM